MLSINYTRLQREIVLEVQLTKNEKLADSFRLARFTLADSLICSSNPWQTVLIFFGFLFISAPFLFSSTTFLSDLSDKFCSGHNGLLAKDSEG